MDLDVDKDYIRQAIKDFKARYALYVNKGLKWEHKDDVSKKGFIDKTLAYFG